MTIGIYILLLLLSVAYTVAWIITIIYQGKRHLWGWMVLTIIFNVVLIIYWITWLFSDKLKKKQKI